MAAEIPASFPIQPGPGRSPARGEVPIRAFVFDTYGTVCDFFRPLRAAFDRLGAARGVSWDAGALAVEWRAAYARSTFLHAGFGMEFRPLREIHRDNLETLLAARLETPLADDEREDLLETWNRMDAWPDAVEGICALKARAIVAPLSNGNFSDMVRLARHASLPWDIILGSSVARAYKPHPRIYLESVAALALEPREVCMVAAHQVDLRFAAGHGMQTAFVIRRDEFGGPEREAQSAGEEDALAVAETVAVDDWTFVAESFPDLARQAAPLCG